MVFIDKEVFVFDYIEVFILLWDWKLGGRVERFVCKFRLMRFFLVRYKEFLVLFYIDFLILILGV